MRYKVKSGQHWIDGIAYPSGSTFEAGPGLDRAFPGRFEILPDPPQKDTKPEHIDSETIESRPVRKKRRKVAV